jgi:D-glycero-D-manno-heptose 1,7-bisphosphate phosphatase
MKELELLPDVASSLHDLKAHGFALFVITNQPDVSRGTQTRDAVEAIHRELASSLPIDDIFVCYHDDADHCACRKPNPGMLLEAQRKHNIDLSRSFVIGDRWRDIDAGHAAGCKTVLIDYGYRERKPARPPEATVRSLREAADWILCSSLKESTNKDEVRI